jgi:hypothetical protein
MNELSDLVPGRRVRVVRSTTIASKISAGREGTVVEYRPEHIPMLEAFPIAMVLDGRTVAQVWNADELELIT